MAVDFDAIKRKLDQLSGNNKKSSKSWRPQEGEEYTVRLLSFPDNDGQPFKELWFYYNIGNNRGLLAPYQFNKDDPFQELITKLKEDGSKESYELCKKLYPKMRCYAPVIVRGEEEKGVQIWGFGKMVYQSLLNIMLDEDYGDITDPLEGRDVKVACVRQPGRKWATTEVRPRGKQSKLDNDASQIQAWVSEVPSLENMYELKTYDELAKIINDWLNEDSSDEDETGTTPGASANGSNSSTTKTPDTSGGGSYKSLDDAFADLMD